MRTYVFVALLGAASLATLRGATLNVRDFGALADDYTNEVPDFKKAISAAQKDGPAPPYSFLREVRGSSRARNVTTATGHGRR